MIAGKATSVSNGNFTSFTMDGMSILQAGVLCLNAGESYALEDHARETGLLLIRGECILETRDNVIRFGPRENPFIQRPWAFLLGRGRRVVINAEQDSVLGVGSAPAQSALPDTFIPPENTGGGPRGEGCFSREVRFAIWNDNSNGNQLMIGETIIPPGHWSSFPPHKHDTCSPGHEARYEEAYYFSFELQTGFALVRQYNRSGCDQTVCAHTGELIYMAEGYHPVVNSPEGYAYQMTLMAGPQRQSTASLDSYFIKEGSENPFQNQQVMK